MASWWDAVKRFYVRNFPTDKPTVDATISIISLAFSFMNLGLLTCHTYNVTFFAGFSSTPVIMLLIGGPTYQLYYGLCIGDRKYTSMWVVLKIVENLSAVLFVYFPSIVWYPHYNFYLIIPGSILIVFHVLYVVLVLRRVGAMPSGHLENLYATSTPLMNEKVDVCDMK